MLTRTRSPVERGRRIDLASLLEERAEQLAGSVLFAFPRERRQLTYGEFDALANRFANGLRRLGIVKGEFVALMLRSGEQYLVASYALKKIGAVEVALNPEFRGPSLARAINLAPAAVLISSREMLEPLATVAAELEHVRRVVMTDAAPSDAEAAMPGVDALTFAELVSSDESRPARDVRDTDLQAILFTSGTTGVSKGCMASHRYAIRFAESLIDPLGLTSEDRVFTPYPLSHVAAAYMDVLPQILVGGSAAVVPRFSASRFWDEVRETRATLFMVMGTLGKILLATDPSPSDRDHHVKRVWGGPMPFDTDVFEERFGVELLRGGGYSSTDAGSVGLPQSSRGLPPTCTGKVNPSYEVRIADDDGYPVPTGAIGEILVRALEPDIMAKGYLGMPEATLEARRDLWFHSGDLGFFDDDGHLHFVGRKQERIRRGGENVSAYEVEEVIEAHPAVAEAAVVPVAAQMGEDDIHAYVQLREAAELTADDLREFCIGQMAKYMVPTRFVFVRELPKTHTGKVAVGELREMPA
jgi:carnitine-CoA ligase